jgi:cell wall-associated NlpC family hydrolase
MKTAICILVSGLLSISASLAQDAWEITIDSGEAASSTISEVVRKRNELISTAEIYLGCPYKYAAGMPENGFDCSGFVHYIYNSFDISTPRSSRDYEQIKPKLDLKKAKPGDVIVFKGRAKNGKTPGHVGIITSIDSSEVHFIHSSTSRGIMISEVNEEYYKKRFLFAVGFMPEKEPSK